MATLRSNLVQVGGIVALALLCAVPVVAEEQSLEEIIREEAFAEIEEALGQAPQASVSAPALLRPASRLKTAAAPVTAGSFRCLPTCDTTDGRFLAIASPGFGTLSPTELNLAISVPAGSTSFDIGFFDGDGGEYDSLGNANWDSGLTVLFDYTLYADPDADGSGLSVVEMLPGSPSLLSNSMPDNAWTNYTVSTGPVAETPSGNFFYILKIRLLTPSITLNAFKVRTTAVLSGLTLDPIARPFSYIAAWTALTDISVVYPSFPSPTPTTYDGSFRFYFDVPVSQDELAIWDGDFDRGKWDLTEQDTNDADTPGAPFLPDWSTLETLPEGVALGTAGGTGNPADDARGTGFGAYILRAPSVRYELTASDGQTFANANPSGNLEWEQFKLSTAPFSASQMDLNTSSIPPGTYKLEIKGVDMLNLNALLLPFRLLCVDELGNPCVLLRPYLIGRQVFVDTDGNGSQGPGEAGIAGVTLSLYDSHGALLATATTDAWGRYSFPADSATYEVRIDAANLQAGGPLAGYVSTTGGESRTDTVYDDNVMTYTFGYRGTASLGDRVWNDLDGDGIQDAGEAGFDGVTVELLDGNGAVVSTTTTSGGGSYSFEGLPAGSYTVRVVSSTLPAGLAPTHDADGVATPYTATVTLAAGEDRSDLNFGFRKLITLGDRVWNDHDGDGAQDAGEPGLNDVTVQLLDSASNVLATTVTSGDGSYSFPNLAAGVIYKIRVVAPAGMAPTYDVDGTATPNIATVAAADSLSGIDFGYRTTARPGTGTIGYWKNHAEAWPVQQITVGGVTYSKAQAISLMGQAGKGDKTIDLYKQLVASMLNVILGNEASCISATIDAANAWLTNYPVGSKVKSSSPAWIVGGPLHTTLDAYNNGNLCAPHRD